MSVEPKFVDDSSFWTFLLLIFSPPIYQWLFKKLNFSRAKVFRLFFLFALLKQTRNETQTTCNKYKLMHSIQVWSRFDLWYINSDFFNIWKRETWESVWTFFCPWFLTNTFVLSFSNEIRIFFEPSRVNLCLSLLFPQ